MLDLSAIYYVAIVAMVIGGYALLRNMAYAVTQALMFTALAMRREKRRLNRNNNRKHYALHATAPKQRERSVQTVRIASIAQDKANFGQIGQDLVARKTTKPMAIKQSSNVPAQQAQQVDWSEYDIPTYLRAGTLIV